ncbi:MAG: BatD family protein [Bacteroidales bacterium]|nr:BatD family protein [Bacteroidales bacterium]
MKRLSIILVSILVAASLHAQSIKVEAPNLVGADEQFNVSFSVEGEHAPSEFEWEPGDGFRLVWGPQKGTSTSISIVNGKRSKSVTNSYTYVLMPSRTGTFTLPGATATIQGKKVSSRSFSIEVVAGNASRNNSGAAASSGNSAARQQQATGNISSDDIYMRLIVNKTRAVVGEGISATLKLYQRVNVQGFEDARFPSFNGFWSQELQAPSSIEFKRENVGGEIFNTAVLRSWNLIPQKAGDVTIEPAELVCLVNVRAATSSSGSIFDSFFQDNYRTVRKRVTTQPVTLHISALPAGAPASFGGGVGKFDMKAELTRDSLKTHDAASLKVTISGTGNLALLTAPKVSFPPDFEVYDMKSTDSGRSRVFEYPFIPRSHGEFEIGPVEYSYYDISSGRYVTLTSGPLMLTVARGAELESAVPAGGQLVQTRRDVKDLGSDIRFISSKLPSLSSTGRFFVWSPLFWGLAAFLLLAAAAVWFILRRRAALRADVAGSRNRAATKMARKRLAQAGEFLQKNLYTAFYEELHKTLLGFISDKLNMDATDMSKENISARLCSEGVSEGLAADFSALLDACEYARYAPDAGHDAMNSHYESAVSVISAIDSSMKKKKTSGGAAVLALLLMFVPFGGHAADAYLDSLWNAGVAAYTDGRWQDASQAWAAIENVGMASPELYCNLGDAYFRQSMLADAILYYSRALKLDPSFADARYNLEFARSLTQDRIDSVPEFFLRSWMRKLCWMLPSDAWAWISLALLAAVLALALLFLLGRVSAARRWGFFGGLAVLVLMVFALIFAAWQKRDYVRADDAVVMRPVVPVKSAPSGADTKDLFILHEGTCVEVLDSVGDWCNVKLSDGREGWLKKDGISII